MTSISDIRKQYPQYDDMSDIDLGRALHKKHYSDMPEAEFMSKIGVDYGPTVKNGTIGQPPPEFRSARGGDYMLDMSRVAGRLPGNALKRGAMQGTTANFADEVISAGMTPIEMLAGALSGEDKGKGIGQRTTDAYGRVSGFNRALDKQAQQDAPGQYLAGQIGGGLLAAGKMNDAGLSFMRGAKPTLGSLMGRGAAEGGIYGGVYGAGAGEGIDDTIGKAAWGVGIGTPTGGLMGAATRPFVGAKPNVKIPTSEDFAARSSGLYKQSEQAGVVIKPQAMNRLIADMKSKAGRLNDKLRPMTFGVVDDLDDYANKPMTLEVLDEFRQEIAGAMKGAKPGDLRQLTIMRNQLDDFADNLRPGVDVGGDVKAGVQYLKQARDAWKTSKKAELIDNTIDFAELQSAQYTQSGIKNTLRTKFGALERKLINSKKDAASFTAEERAMIRQLAEGKTSNAAIRWLAKFSPSGPVSFMAGLGATAVNPAGVALPIAGKGADMLADKVASQAAQNLVSTVATGKPLPQAALTTAQKRIIDALTATSSQQASKIPGLGGNSR